jgi:conjugal transfer/entry exclusion protein
MPESWTFENSAEHMAQMRQQTDLATREAARAQAASRSSIDAALQMSDEAMDLSQGDEGQTQAIQAQTQMLRSQIAVAAAQQAADAASATAALRTTEEQRAQDVIANQKIERFYGPGSLDLPPVSGRALFQ